MAIKRISDLDSLSQFQDSDLFLISRPIEGKSYKAGYTTLFNKIKDNLDLNSVITSLITSQIKDKFPVTNSNGSLVHYNKIADAWTATNPIHKMDLAPTQGGIDFSNALGGLQLRWGNYTATTSDETSPIVYTIPYATWNDPTLSAVNPANILYATATCSDPTNTSNILSVTVNTNTKELQMGASANTLNNKLIKFLVIAYQTV